MRHIGMKLGRSSSLGCVVARNISNLAQNHYGKGVTNDFRAFSTLRQFDDDARLGILQKLRPIGDGEVKLRKNGEREAWISFENPGKKNAFSGKMMAELHDAVHTLKTEQEYRSTTVLFVQGTKDFFCSGADLSAVKGHFTKNDGLRMSLLMQKTLGEMRSLNKLSVAVVSGSGCVGGGTELALSCDFRVFEHSARYQMIHTKLGMIPGWGGLSRLVAMVGRRNALKILCSGKRFDAQECLALGIADIVGEPGQSAQEVAVEFMKPYYENVECPNAVQECKRLIAFADDNPSMELSLDVEREAFSHVWQGPENLAQLAKLAAKKKK